MTKDFIEPVGGSLPTIASVVIKKDGKYLLIQEKKPQVYGRWNKPGGKVDVGETVEQAAIREAKEETGFDVELVRKIGIFPASALGVVVHVFEAEIVGGELNFPKDEILDARWFTFDEIKQMQDNLRNKCIIDAINILEKSA